MKEKIRKEKVRKKIIWDERGVSEIIADIMILSMTVVLFSAVFLFVWTMETPDETIYADLVGDIEMDSDGTGARINITHESGEDLYGPRTKIYLYKNFGEELRILDTKSDTGDPENPDGYGLEGDTTWSPGETWTYFYANVVSSDDLEVRILNTRLNSIIMSSKLLGASVKAPPIIMERWHTPSPAMNGSRLTIHAKVKDPNGNADIDTVYVNVSALNGSLGSLEMTDPDNDGIFEVSFGVDADIGSYTLTICTKDIGSPPLFDRARLVVNVVRYTILNPDLTIDEGDITFSNPSPTRGKTVTISAAVMNLGGSAGAGRLIFYDDDDPIGMDNISVAAGGESFAQVTWFAAPGGDHTIRVVIDNVVPADSNESNNEQDVNIAVLPALLLVDDDLAPNDGEIMDSAGHMAFALEAGGFTFDYHDTQVDGPVLHVGGHHPLRDYDVVVWTTGFNSLQTLTAQDRTELEDFLDDGGKLWLIGEGMLHDGGNVAWSYLDLSLDDLDVSPVDPIYGSSGHPITDGWTLSTDLEGRSPTADALIPGATSLEMYEDNDGYIIGLSREVDLGDDLFYRLVFGTWDLVNLDLRNDQVEVVYRTILWLGVIPGLSGEDVSVSDVVIEPSAPQYRDVVTLSGTVRNNGMSNQTVDVAFIIDGVEIGRKSVTVAASGGSAIAETTWLASTLGAHQVRIRVDPDNVIVEVNEENNVAEGRTIQTELVVTYRLLLVDDDESSNNNGGTLANTTSQINDALTNLGYPFTYYTINASESGPTLEFLEMHNAIIWVLGEAATSTLTANDQLNLTVYLGMNGGFLWLIGENFLEDPDLDPGVTNFVDTVLHVDSYTPDVPLSDPLYGVFMDPVSHGMQLETSGRDSDEIDPGSEAYAVLMGSNGDTFALRYDDDTNDSKLVLCSFIPEAILGGVQPPDGDSAIQELTYMILRWFGQPEIRIELRSTRADLYLSDYHPIIGRSFVLRARVFNVGGSPSGFLVRFMDGNTQVGSDTVALEAGANASIEALWTPLFAGPRTITIRVDPLNEVPEIFEFNNDPFMQTEIFFFWDDMENGTGLWEHEATLVRINGEVPLEFLTAYSEIYTNVNDSWDLNMSNGILTTSLEYHTYNVSYWLSEPIGGVAKSVDVVLTIDSSGSMDEGTKMPDAKDAAKSFVDNLGEEDRAAVIDFDSAVDIEQEFTNDTQAVKDAIDALDPWDPGYMTELYDAVIESIEYAAANSNNIRVVIVLTDGQDTASENTLQDAIDCVQDHNETGPDPLVYVFTIGLGSDVDEDVLESLATKPEYYYFAPNSSELAGIYEEIYQEVLLLSEGAARSVSSASNDVDSRATVTIFEDDFETDLSKWNGNGATAWDRSADQAYEGSWSVRGSNNNEGWITSDDIDLSSVTSAHLDFWFRKVNTEANDFTLFFYDGSGYNNILELDGEGGDNTWLHYNNVAIDLGTYGISNFRIRFDATLEWNEYVWVDYLVLTGETPDGGGDGGEGQEPIPGNKTATTYALDLSGAEEATLSFWHKYNILPNVNGVFVEVGYRTSPSGPWLWNYSTPKQPYTGNLYLEVNRTDDFGNEIIWAWNGLSGGGTFTWEKVELNILRFVPSAYRDAVRIRFNYTAYSGGTGYGYYLDDVEVTIRSGALDYWDLTTTEAYSGSYSWHNVDSGTNAFPEGVDNSLISGPIDLSGAREAKLEAVFKFNINEEPGVPPDGFRVEISSDNGETWRAINLGARSAWGVSGSDSTLPKSYTGYDLGDNWVSSDTLTRLLVDLTGWTGQQIRIRFRVVTTLTNSYPSPYQHYETNPSSLGFGGLFIDDVRVTGLSIAG